MKIFKAIKKLITYLAEENDDMKYEQPSLQEEVKENPPVNVEEPIIENPYVNRVVEWAVNKIDLLHEADRHRNAKALAAEFDEWINIPDNVGEVDYFYIEDDGWTKDSEIDIRE